MSPVTNWPSGLHRRLTIYGVILCPQPCRNNKAVYVILVRLILWDDDVGPPQWIDDADVLLGKRLSLRQLAFDRQFFLYKYRASTPTSNACSKYVDDTSPYNCPSHCKCLVYMHDPQLRLSIFRFRFTCLTYSSSFFFFCATPGWLVGLLPTTSMHLVTYIHCKRFMLVHSRQSSHNAASVRECSWLVKKFDSDNMFCYRCCRPNCMLWTSMQ